MKAEQFTEIINTLKKSLAALFDFMENDSADLMITTTKLRVATLKKTHG